MKFIIILFSLFLVSCETSSPPSNPEAESTNLECALANSDVPELGYQIIQTYPHDPEAYTQGLLYDNGVLYESTGNYGSSDIRKVELETGRVLQIQSIADDLFGEGLTLFEGRLFQLTWKANKGFVYEKDTFEILQEFSYPTEGWGLTHYENKLILSDGTANLYFLDPYTFKEESRISAHYKNSMEADCSVSFLNELEFIQGEIWANIWQTDTIVMISPQTGKITGWINLRGLLSQEEENAGANVLNGIAYDNETQRLWVTGKYWPKLFEIELIHR